MNFKMLILTDTQKLPLGLFNFLQGKLRSNTGSFLSGPRIPQRPAVQKPQSEGLPQSSVSWASNQPQMAGPNAFLAPTCIVLAF